LEGIGRIQFECAILVSSEGPGESHETPYSLRSGTVSIFVTSTTYFIELRFQEPQTALQSIRRFDLAQVAVMYRRGSGETFFVEVVDTNVN